MWVGTFFYIDFTLHSYKFICKNIKLYTNIKYMNKILMFLLGSIVLWLAGCGMQVTETRQQAADGSWQLAGQQNPIDQTKTILALWDSLTAWYQIDITDSYPSQLEALLQKNWYNYKIINAWVSWETTKAVLQRVKLYLEAKPDLVILVVWWNDWLRGLSITEARSNIIDIINEFKNAGVPIVLWGMQIPSNLWQTYTSQFAQMYPDIAKETNVSLLPFFLEGVALDPSLNIGDGIHPNKQGYAIIAQNIYNFLVNKELIHHD